MINFEAAFEKVMAHATDYGIETVDLLAANGRVLAEEIFADRDFPPFHRSTKDGIGIEFEAYEKGQRTFEITGVAAAGAPQVTLANAAHGVEVMTGAMLPLGADTIVMYEHLEIVNGLATIQKPVKRGQNIHQQGSDTLKGASLLTENQQITPTEIGVLATVGKAKVLVKKRPSVAVISTGNELVAVEKTPLAHQIRRSNVLSLQAALSDLGLASESFHLSDSKVVLRDKIKALLAQKDILLLSGGVSKGKFDFLPEIFEELGVEKVFHKVQQRPGKPFWFGRHRASNTLIFSFPGNPVSTFVCFQVYFVAWLRKSLGLPPTAKKVRLGVEIAANKNLTLLKQVRLIQQENYWVAMPILANGSGDLLSLSASTGIVHLPAREEAYQVNELVDFWEF